MGIEMSGMDGLQVAKMMRRSDIVALIGFMPNYNEQLLISFDVRACHYLVKSLSGVKATEVLLFAKQFFSISHKQFYSLFVLKNEYFESRGSKICLRRLDETIHEYVEALNEVEIKKEPLRFARSHKSCLVNIECLFPYEGTEQMLGGCPYD